jgi:hypothetical protein
MGDLICGAAARHLRLHLADPGTGKTRCRVFNILFQILEMALKPRDELIAPKNTPATEQQN